MHRQREDEQTSFPNQSLKQAYPETLRLRFTTRDDRGQLFVIANQSYMPRLNRGN